MTAPREPFQPRSRRTRQSNSGKRSLIVVTYDISDDRRRTRVAEVLLSFGGRVQGSVYELWLDDRRLERMWDAVGKLVTNDDLVRCYVLCGACEGRVRSYGMDAPGDPVVFIV